MSPILPDATHCITCRFRHAECWWIWHLCPWSSLLEGKSDGIITTWHDFASRRSGGRSHSRNPRRVARSRTHPHKETKTSRKTSSHILQTQPAAKSGTKNPFTIITECGHFRLLPASTQKRKTQKIWNCFWNGPWNFWRIPKKKNPL